MTQIIQLLIDLFLFLIAWILQLAIYPDFLKMSKEILKSKHLKCIKLFYVFVIPAMVLQLLIIVHHILFDTQNIYFISGILAALGFTVTFSKLRPIQKQIQTKDDNIALVQELIRTNRIRVFAWTSIILLDIVIYFWN